MTSKALRELAALRGIYDSVLLRSAQAGDKPDFVLRSSAGSSAFGVEITEIHATDSAARLKHVPGYAVELLNGGSVRHHADASILIDDVVFTSEDGRTVRGRALQQDSLTIHDFLERLASTVDRKSEKARGYECELSHLNLIVVDHSHPFILQNVEVVNSVILSESVQCAVIQGAFNEVFVTTRIAADDTQPARDIYLPLRQLTLTSLLFQFPSALASFAPGHQFDDLTAFVSALGDYLLSRGMSVTWRSLDGRMELLLGTIGLSMTDEPRIFINDYTDAPDGSALEPPDSAVAPWRAESFENHFIEHRRRHTVRLSCIFPLKASV